MKDNTGIKLDRNLLKEDRPYFIIPDNVKSNMRIEHIENFESVQQLLDKTSLTKASKDLSFYRVEYLTKQVIQYEK